MAIHSFALMNELKQPRRGLLGSQPQNPFYGASPSTGGGLLGLGGFGAMSGPSIPAGLLGNFDPKEMRRKQISRALLGMGAAILANGKGTAGEVIGQGLAGGIQGADQAQQDYTNNAMLQQKLQTEADQRQREAEQRQKMQDWITNNTNGMTPAQRGFAAADPQAAMTQYGQTLFAPPPNPLEPPTSVQEYNYGLTHPQFTDYLTNQKRASA